MATSTAGVTTRPNVRDDVGYFAADVVRAAVEAGCAVSLAATRNPAVGRAAVVIRDSACRKAKWMAARLVRHAGRPPSGYPWAATWLADSRNGYAAAVTSNGFQVTVSLPPADTSMVIVSRFEYPPGRPSYGCSSAGNRARSPRLGETDSPPAGR